MTEYIQLSLDGLIVNWPTQTSRPPTRVDDVDIVYLDLELFNEVDINAPVYYYRRREETKCWVRA